MHHPSLIALSHDHHHGLALALRCRKQALGQIRPMGRAGLEARAEEVKSFFSGDLSRHFRAEEEVLLPLMRVRIPESGAIIDQLLEEHEQIGRAVSQLENGADLARTLFGLGDLLERHIRKEERELFPLFDKGVDEESAERAGEKMKAILVPG